MTTGRSAAVIAHSSASEAQVQLLDLNLDLATNTVTVTVAATDTGPDKKRHLQPPSPAHLVHHLLDQDAVDAAAHVVKPSDVPGGLSQLPYPLTATSGSGSGTPLARTANNTSNASSLQQANANANASTNASAYFANNNIAAPDASRPSRSSSRHRDDPEDDANTIANLNPSASVNSLTASLTPSLTTNSLTTGDLQNLPSPHQTPASSIRKTSPGLAARLKALGFGSTRKSSPDPTPPVGDRNIGRLNENQLRQLDENHQAASANFVIPRRGRPWKGAGGIPSLRSFGGPSPGDKPDAGSPHSLVPADSPQLPEIRTPEPLAMDTQKYRLPDHTNGNGTKVTLDTRREHLERTARPPSVDHVATPPPAPPPKDTPPLIAEQWRRPPAAPITPPVVSAADDNSASDYIPGLSSYFTRGHTRPGSIYTLSRASFANQLAQLTSLQLPDADSLSSKVSAIPTAQAAASALINAADQIRSWISKAQEVIGGLDSEDDVEWAAAGGREGLEEVENAIVRFEELINAYVGAIEGLQARNDVSSVAANDLKRAVSQMEIIITEWSKIRATLQTVRVQVEIAMEWEELWNNVLGDIQDEMDELIRLVFEMEERRHKSLVAAASGDSVDIGDLETIVEETPPPVVRLQAPSRFSLPALPMTPGSPGTPSLSQDDSSLLALFARMQPLRASLDFLPMRLSVFENRAEQAFPTACEELEMRREGLDGNYKKLEKDAESLRKELGEDRWVIVFRGAGRQAQKMHESVERSLLKLKEALDAELHLTNQPTMVKKMESYEAKKTHYGPAIERVLSIIDKGVQDRLTVNGEILRLHAEMQSRWASLKQQIKEMDAVLEDVQADRKSQQLRDSISSMLSNDQSTLGSGRETPGSSPPSSVIMSSLGFDPHTPSTTKQTKARSPAVGGSVPSNRRHSSLPAPASQIASRKGSRLSTIPSSSLNTPVPASKMQRPGSTLGNRPVWNGSTNASHVDTGHNFKPLSLTTPSPYAKGSPSARRSVSTMTPSSGGSRLPTLRNALTRALSESPNVDETPSRTGHSRLSFRERLASPGPQNKTPRLSAKTSMSNLTNNNRRASFQPFGSTSTAESQPSRPVSSLASTSRRSSLLPQPKANKGGSTGRASPQIPLPGRFNTRKLSSTEDASSKPRWRH